MAESIKTKLKALRNIQELIVQELQKKEKEITSLNKERLAKGLDAEGEKIKTLAGNVGDLYETGAFYKTISTEVTEDTMAFSADFDIHGFDIRLNYIKDYAFLGLTEKQDKEIKEEILEKVRKRLYENNT